MSTRYGQSAKIAQLERRALLGDLRAVALIIDLGREARRLVRWTRDESAHVSKVARRELHEAESQTLARAQQFEDEDKRQKERIA